MQRAVCTLCTSFGSWTFFRPFPFKGTAYGAYGRIRRRLQSGLGSTACRHWDASRPRKPKVHTDFRRLRRKRPPMKSIRLRPSLIPFDAPAVFCPWKRFFGPSDGLSSFWRISRRHPIRAVPQGPPRIRFSDNDGGWNKKRHGNVIVFSVIPSPALHGPMGYGQSSAPYRRPESPLKMKLGSGQSKPVFTLLSHYADIMHFVCSRMHQLCTFCPKARSQ